jgi:hypothetical protein
MNTWARNTRKGHPIATGEDGLEGYMMRLAMHEPKVFGSLLCRVLLMTITADTTQSETQSEAGRTLAENFAKMKADGLGDALAYYLTKYPLTEEERAELQVNRLIAVDLVVASPSFGPTLDQDARKKQGANRRPALPHGRRRDANNKFTKSIKDAVLYAAKRVGFVGKDKRGNPIATGKDGLEGYMMWLAMMEPKVYGNILCRIPQMTIADEIGQLKEYLTLEEAKAKLRESGLDETLAYYFPRYPKKKDFGPSPYPDVVALDGPELKETAEYTGTDETQKN